MHVRVAVAAAAEAQAEGLARVPLSTREIETARAVMQSARDATAALMRAGLIAAPRAEGRHEDAP